MSGERRATDFALAALANTGGGFNPDAYLAKKAKPKQFDPDAYLKVKVGRAGGPITMEPGGGLPSIHGGQGAQDEHDLPPGDIHNATPGAAPDAAESFLRGEVQGGTFGFGDEIGGASGAVEALNNRLRTSVGLADTRPEREQQLAADLGEKPLGMEALDSYRGARDQMRRMDAAAQKENPGSYLGGNMLGAVAVPVPGPGKASTLSRLAKAGLSVAKGAGLGAVGGLGASGADLTTGDVGGAARDVGVGAGIGGAVGLGGELLGALSRKFGGKVAGAEAAALAKTTAEKEKQIASALGKYRSGVQSASRDLEVLTAAAKDAAHPMHQEAAAFLNTPEAEALMSQVTGNKLATAPDRISEMQSLKAAHEALLAGKDSAIQSGTAEALAPTTAGKKLLKFLYNYGTRIGPALGGAALGFDHGGAQGGVLGTALGGVLGMVAGHGGTAAKNLYKSPGMQRALFSVLEKGAQLPAYAAGQTALPAVAAAKLSPLLEALTKQKSDSEALAEALRSAP